MSCFFSEKSLLINEYKCWTDYFGEIAFIIGFFFVIILFREQFHFFDLQLTSNLDTLSSESLYVDCQDPRSLLCVTVYLEISHSILNSPLILIRSFPVVELHFQCWDYQKYQLSNVQLLIECWVKTCMFQFILLSPTTFQEL